MLEKMLWIGINPMYHIPAIARMNNGALKAPETALYGLDECLAVQTGKSAHAASVAATHIRKGAAR